MLGEADDTPGATCRQSATGADGRADRSASESAGPTPDSLLRPRGPSTGDAAEVLQRVVSACRICRDAPRASALPHEPRPILRLSSTARLLIASQAPGLRAHDSGIPFEDPSGDRLRSWLGVDRGVFHDASRIAIVPMGFCFPGHDKAKGDLPPRRECLPAWHHRLFPSMPQVETVVAVGLHAIRFHTARLAPERPAPVSLDGAVRAWRASFDRPAPRLLPMPHPSWRNSAWIKRNPWFEDELLPVLRAEVRRLVR